MYTYLEIHDEINHDAVCSVYFKSSSELYVSGKKTHKKHLTKFAILTIFQSFYTCTDWPMEIMLIAESQLYMYFSVY